MSASLYLQYTLRYISSSSESFISISPGRDDVEGGSTDGMRREGLKGLGPKTSSRLCHRRGSSAGNQSALVILLDMVGGVLENGGGNRCVRS